MDEITDNKMLLENEGFQWCLIGNVGERSNKESTDTAHFSKGTKVHCFASQWGDGYEKIKVYGLHKKTKKPIVIVLASKYIANWRVKKVYNPNILERLGGELANWASKEEVEEWAQLLIKRGEEQ